jgi:hypothetical protein
VGRIIRQFARKRGIIRPNNPLALEAAAGRIPNMAPTIRTGISSGKPKLLNQVRDVIRRKHFSIRTEQAYADWIRRFILFHRKRHPIGQRSEVGGGGRRSRVGTKLSFEDHGVPKQSLGTRVSRIRQGCGRTGALTSDLRLPTSGQSTLWQDRHAAGLGAFDEGLLGFLGVDDEGVVLTKLRPGAVGDFAEVDEFPVGHVGLVDAEEIAHGR